MQPYEWRGFRQTRGIRSKAKRVLTQFSPHDFTAFKWGTATDFLHFSTVVLLLAVFLAAELNPFYLKVREKKAYIIDYLIKAKAIFHLRPTFFSLRACCGWNRIILLSFLDWRSYFSVLFRLFANCSSILTIRGKFIIIFFFFFIRPRLIIH